MSIFEYLVSLLEKEEHLKLASIIIAALSLFLGFIRIIVDYLVIPLFRYFARTKNRIKLSIGISKIAVNTIPYSRPNLEVPVIKMTIENVSKEKVIIKRIVFSKLNFIMGLIPKRKNFESNKLNLDLPQQFSI